MCCNNDAAYKEVRYVKSLIHQDKGRGRKKNEAFQIITGIASFDVFCITGKMSRRYQADADSKSQERRDIERINN